MDEQSSSPILVYRRLGSTNDEALRLLKEQAPHGTTVVAQEQSAGRGRRESDGQRRPWHSPGGSNVYLSMVLRPALELAKVAGVTLACGVEIAGMLREISGVDVWLKWPNDLYAGERKLGGILTEAATGPTGLEGVVVGVGLNVNIGRWELPEELHPVATSLLSEGGQVYDRMLLVDALQQAILRACTRLETKGLEDFGADFAALDRVKGREVRYEQGGSAMRGIADGLSPSGGLRVKDVDGRIVEVVAGEVTICGLGRGHRSSERERAPRPQAEVEAHVERLLTAQPGSPPEARRVRRRFAVQEVAPEGSRYVRLAVEVDEEFAASLQRPGQYTTLGAAGLPPSFYVVARARQRRWEFLVEAEGDLAQALAGLKPGDEVEVSLAEGRGFEAREAVGASALLFATGSGLAALLPLVERWLEAPARPARIALFYGERHDDDLACRALLSALEARGVQVCMALEEGGEHTYVQDAFAALAPPLDGAFAYLSGAPVMVKAVTETLMKAGVPAGRIQVNI
ncbi:biotin--[acetyl-CoA-carboxylase] ligase [Lujinxingia litoralis]|uniref:Biotin--[acetyl-CoA-carboxylase] ligase n=1 Tax=Lujinxingia litoralis TaxID=2211119 RepID=A0A328CAE7_9DELT|nr:biotin--[acetyl-CoA-carboxylase] ligase [Lujinxingia litoralis]RAL22217.1 biotin--[acetyl-CoA-carboxylase] ligase [Lujinxingia litoralis]